MENKIFPYAVIYEGVFYPANTPIQMKRKQDAETPKEERKPKKGGAKK